MKKLFWLFLLLLLPTLAFPQGSRFDSVAQKNVQNFLAPIPGAQITVCSSAGSGTPCSPITPIYTDAGLTQQIAGSTFPADSNGNFGFWAPPGTYKYSITATGVTGQLYTIVLPINTAANLTFTGTDIFTQQIISNATQGTAPFSIASTTLVANLNAGLLGGFPAPATAIVGVNDSQTLTAKTLTAPVITNPTITGGGSWAGSPALTTPTIDGTAAGHVVQQISAATNYGTALGSQTIIASMPVTGNVSLLLIPVQVTAGVGCSAATNSVTVNPVTWTGPGGTAESANPSSNMGFTGNGAVDSGSSTFGSSAFTNNGIQAVVAKSGTAIAYSTTSTLASTGCTTVPQYVIYAKAFF